MIVRKNLFILVFLVLNGFFEMILTQSFYPSSFLKELQKCYESENDVKCQEMILLAERMQLREYYEGNLKCQTSILGAQTELIRNIYFGRNKDDISKETTSSLIKNC